MSSRLKSGLSLLLMLLVFAASSQAAVCELACDLGARSVACHTPVASEKEDVPSSAMPAMSHRHCVPVMHEKKVKAKFTANARMAHFTGIHDLRCYYVFAPAIIDTAAAGPLLSDVHWSVVGDVPVAAMLPETRRVVLQSLPPLYAPADSRLVTLRI